MPKEWISVEDSLPEVPEGEGGWESEPHIVLISTKVMCVAVYDHWEKDWFSQRVFLGYNVRGDRLSNVTHYRPMPPQPEEELSDEF